MDQMGSGLAEMLKRSPLYELYSQAASRVQDWPVLLDKAGELMRQDYDWSAEISKITSRAAGSGPGSCSPSRRR
jgi:hypothetical protein